MTTEDNLKITSSGLAVVGELIKMAGESPNGKEAANNIGKTAVTVTKAINNILLPIAAVNFAFDKARTYYSEKFKGDLEEKIKLIPENDLVEPKASIAGPVLQGLAFSHEEDSLRNMYLNLLASAMTITGQEIAHPAFAEIIKQLNGVEAGILRDVLRSHQLPIAQLQASLDINQARGYHVVSNHLINLTNSDTGEAEVNSRFPAMIQNWIRLGLIEVSYEKRLATLENYSWISTRPEFIVEKEACDKNGTFLNC